jgi:hypothetical protein
MYRGKVVSHTGCIDTSVLILEAVYAMMPQRLSKQATLRRLQANLFDAAGHFFLSGLSRGPILALLRSFDAVRSSACRFLGLLPLLLGLLGRRFSSLFLFGFASLLAAKLLAPFLLLLGLDLGEEVAGCSDLVADGQ